MAILRGSPNINAARLFVNWFLSKEGQISQYVADYAPPVHKALQRKELLPFADQILGKEIAFRDPALELEVQPKLLELWDQLWLKSGGRRRSGPYWARLSASISGSTESSCSSFFSCSRRSPSLCWGASAPPGSPAIFPSPRWGS
jgi:hypothetical protein